MHAGQGAVSVRGDRSAVGTGRGGDGQQRRTPRAAQLSMPCDRRAGRWSRRAGPGPGGGVRFCLSAHGAPCRVQPISGSSAAEVGPLAARADLRRRRAPSAQSVRPGGEPDPGQRVGLDDVRRGAAGVPGPLDALHDGVRRDPHLGRRRRAPSRRGRRRAAGCRRRGPDGRSGMSRPAAPRSGRRCGRRARRCG